MTDSNAEVDLNPSAIKKPDSRPDKHSTNLLEQGLNIPNKKNITEKEHDQKKIEKKHSAVISKQTNGITITLFTPIAKKPKDNAETELKSNKHKLALIAANKKVIKTKTVNKLNIAPSTISKEIIHIVVKGDTLWHIAKFYVDDPYRYPELAQLSNIKNPDLIYPGDRVHIVQIFTKDTIQNDK